MRCPKCGFISFDSLDSCLKCNKNISEATEAFQGSTLKVETPSFLRIPTADENDLQIEGAAEVGGEIEFADPDLEILVDDDDDQDGIDFNLEGDDETDDLPFASEFEEETTLDDEEDSEFDLAADLGQFEDVPEEDTFSFSDDDEDDSGELEETDLPGMDIPDELSDISDLSPPDSPAVAEPIAEMSAESDPTPPPETVQEPAAEPEDDLDFSNLDFDLNGVDEVVESQDEVAAAAVIDEALSPAKSSMDEDLDFDLDLGGLTITSGKK
ncbi:MAG: hypothetical protein ACR2PH_08750 [Desulfobulbia bacterium]